MSIDLDRYFARVGYDGPRDNSVATLRRLHELHPQAIAFENLDPLLKRPVKLDPASLQAKLVGGGRGGYCFEHNSLFAAVLRQLGFGVEEATARVRWSVPEGMTTPRVHCLLFVEAEGEDYLADVGFGGNVLTAPLKLASREEQATPHEPFRLVEDEDGHLVQEAKLGGEWKPLYAFDFAHTHPVDYEMGNWFTSAHPESIFVNGLMGARAEAGKRYALRDNQLAVHTLGRGTEKTTLKSAGELRDALTDLFKLRLDALEGLDPALAALAARPGA
ncbi:MAG TPA: arylamine N-acetyltransferase [Pseudolabrys sp.]|jgi:N-hydroxyarylamine O-acetyltransferase|nr:arylamine N-acetyltransferase [Pseudolabrys sp.]